MSTKKTIESPDKMMELFNKYVKATKSNPIRKNDFKGKDATLVFYELERPLTMCGFENYVFKQGLNQELSHYFSNYQERYKDYIAICTYIRAEIREDQISGGMAGIYNPSITQRLNSLVDKTEQTIREQPLFGDD
tara:strand:- start:2775 stop:3179 length:405 start_codon:yes stop_codon:yes gene_type:complete